MKTYRGSCTCGAVTFEADLDLSKGTIRCNCSFCKKARLWFAQAKGEQALRVTVGRDKLTDFQRAVAGRPAFLHLYFCRACGVRPFSFAPASPQLGEPFYAVNVCALDDATEDELSAAPIHYVDGAHDNFAGPPANTKYL
ncbi:MAG TPA: GFA family protein [Kofleriaceae bacterium]|jgi:hypothetical protein